MSSEEGDIITDRERRYLKINRKYDYTYDKEDKGKTPLSRGDEEKEFPKLLILTMQDIAGEIKDMTMDRHK